MALAPGPLSQWFGGHGQAIDPSRDQRVVDLLASSVSDLSTFTLQIELMQLPPGSALCFYNGRETAPVLAPIFPPAAGPGWLGILSFRFNPTRVVVTIFDDALALVSTTTTLGADRTAVGLAVVSSEGTSFSQDARNQGGKARALAFAATGISSGDAHMAFETGPGPTATSDFADAIIYLWGGNITPASRASWGTLKSRFR